MSVSVVKDPVSQPGLQPQVQPGLVTTAVAGRQHGELHLTASPLPGESAASCIRRVAEAVRQHGASVVRCEVFGLCSARPALLAAWQQLAGVVDWPIMWVEGLPCHGGELAGVHVMAVTGVPVETVRWRDRIVGRAFSDGWARHLLLSEVLPTRTSASRPEQAREAFENLVEMLQAGGMGMEHLARTWLFLDELLEWYGPFNKVRNDFFREHSVYDRLVPASTGISARNRAGAALVAGAWAAQPVDGFFTMREVFSPLQCPAPKYGSSFSRAVELAVPGLRRVMVSGTASIEPGGASIHHENVRAQIDLTMEVVKEILATRQLGFADASRVTGYFRRAADVAVFEAWCARHGLPRWPVVVTDAPICRDDLLFELELDALSTAPAPK